MDNLSNSDESEQILRRVFGLCFLNTLQYATFRQVLNVIRQNESLTAKDYTIVDYNYVSIKRKEMNQILHAIVQQPGPTIDISNITTLTTLWSTIQSDEPLASYLLVGDRLVKDSDSGLYKRPFVIWDVCPRSGHPRLSFLISFLKSSLPDLMGDSKIENLNSSLPVLPLIDESDIIKWVACFNRARDANLIPLISPSEDQVIKKIDSLFMRLFNDTNNHS